MNKNRFSLHDNFLVEQRTVNSKCLIFTSFPTDIQAIFLMLVKETQKNIFKKLNKNSQQDFK